MANSAPVGREWTTRQGGRGDRIARNPKVDAAPSEARTGDTDQRARDSIQGEAFADQSRVSTELCDPSGISQNEDRESTRLEVRGFEVAALIRSNTQEFERAGSDIVCAEAEIAVTVGVYDVVFCVADEGVEHMILVKVVLKFGVRVLTATALLNGIVETMDVHDDEIALVLIGERFEEGIIDHAEDCGGRTDAKGKCKNRDKGEATIFSHATERELKVFDQNIQVMLPAGLTALILETFDAPKF